MNANTQLAVGTHILCLLSIFPGQPVTSEFLAGSVRTHPVVIRRTLARLRAAGLVESRGGVKGGWVLRREPASITLREVWELTRTGGPLALPRERPNPDCPVGARIQGELEVRFGRAEEALGASLAQTTIAGLVAEMTGAAPAAVPVSGLAPA